MRPAYIVVVAAVGAGISLAAIGVLGAPRSISGLNLAALDKSVKPGDDFFDYAVGGWYATADMPADRSEIGLEQETSALLSLGDKSGGERTATTLSDQRLQQTPTRPLASARSVQFAISTRGIALSTSSQAIVITFSLRSARASGDRKLKRYPARNVSL